jgi:hypothetical protein
VTEKCAGGLEEAAGRLGACHLVCSPRTGSLVGAAAVLGGYVSWHGEEAEYGAWLVVVGVVVAVAAAVGVAVAAAVEHRLRCSRVAIYVCEMFEWMGLWLLGGLLKCILLVYELGGQLSCELIILLLLLLVDGWIRAEGQHGSAMFVFEIAVCISKRLSKM